MLRIGLIGIASVVGAWFGTMPGGPVERQILVFEEPDCAACERARFEVLVPYLTSQDQKSLPMAVIDHAALGTAGHPLGAPVEVLPTVVLLENGAERARLSGYIAPDRFRYMIAPFVPPRD